MGENDPVMWKKNNFTTSIALYHISMLEEGIFSDDWKKSNVVPVDKKKYKFDKKFSSS